MIFLAIILVFILASLRQINEYERGIKFTLGKYSKIMKPGLNLVFPIINSYKKIDIRTKVVDVPIKRLLQRIMFQLV